MAGRHYRCNEHEIGQTGRRWETGRPGVLQSIGLQRVNMTGCLNNNNMLTFYFLICKYLWSLHQRAFQARFFFFKFSIKLKRKKTCKWVFSQVQKGMATHSSILVWKIPWTEGLGGLQSMGLQRAGHNWVTKTSPEALSSMVEQLQHDKTALETIWLVSGDG